MHSDQFMRDCWYVAGRSADFADKLTALTLLGDAVVIYRAPDGTPSALEDACPHRKLPLSKGNLKGGCSRVWLSRADL